MTVNYAHHWFGRSRRDFIAQLRSLADDLESVSKKAFVPTSYVYLDNWFIGERTVPCLLGRFTGHPVITDGRPGFTSEVFFLDDKHKTARTLSRWYLLGDRMNPAFQNQSSTRQ
ncbi:hypothetical protein [Rhizobium leguminosarum]